LIQNKHSNCLAFMKKFTLIILLLLYTLIGFAQKGILKGTITDSKTGESLVGTTVLVQGTTTGTVTNFDGNYLLPDLFPGPYNLVISFISYESQVVRVEIEAEKETELNVQLDPATVDLGEVQVVATRRSDTEMSMLSNLKSQNLIVSGITAQQISRSQDSDAAEVVRRVPGITITDGRFVIVRGLIERYNSVMLNNATAPSFEADKRAFSFDAIPSGLIDNILIYKSPAPELPGDFAGAAIDVQTKSVADLNSFSISYGARYSENTTFNPDFQTHQGSKTDWLGFDNGYRAIPEGIPSDLLFKELYVWPNSNVYLERSQEITRLSNLFPNNWETTTKSPLPDQSFSANLQRRFVLGKISVGNITSLNYNSSSSYTQVIRREFQGWDEVQSRIVENFDFDDLRSKQENKISFIHNWNFIYGKNQKLEVRNFLNQIGTQNTSHRDGINYYNVETLRMYDHRYESRLIYSGQLAGKQTLNQDKTHSNWMLGYSYTSKDQPDNKRLMYVQNTNEESERFNLYALRLQNIPNVYLAGRMWIDMDENVYNAKFDLDHKFTLPGSGKFWQVKSGYFYELKERTLNSRLIGVVAVRNPPDIFYNPVSEIFRPENFYLDANVPPRQHGLSYRDNTRAKDSYDATDHLLAGYLALNIPVSNKINLYGGARVEKFSRVITNFFEKTGTTDNMDITRDTTDIFFSANLTYNINEKNLFRLSYGQTVNRPEFREISNFDYQDFEMFAIVHGNPELLNAYIKNYDLRYEWYPDHGEMISLAAFYKDFTNPIELFQIPAGSTFDYKPFNTEKAYSAGIELDVRKRFLSFENHYGFFRFMKDLTLVFNTSLIKSEINTEKQGFARDSVRIMQGQSPYIVNLGLFYTNAEARIIASINYNNVGKRIAYVGTPNNPHTWELSRNSLDLTLQKGIGNKLQIKGGVKDILNEPIQQVQYHGPNEDKIGHALKYIPNRQFSINLTWVL
jgi:outer membrane receptor for ferrienterochelin and colicin